MDLNDLTLSSEEEATPPPASPRAKRLSFNDREASIRPQTTTNGTTRSRHAPQGGEGAAARPRSGGGGSQANPSTSSLRQSSANDEREGVRERIEIELSSDSDDQEVQVSEARPRSSPKPNSESQREPLAEITLSSDSDSGSEFSRRSPSSSDRRLSRPTPVQNRESSSRSPEPTPTQMRWTRTARGGDRDDSTDEAEVLDDARMPRAPKTPRKRPGPAQAQSVQSSRSPSPRTSAFSLQDQPQSLQRPTPSTRSPPSITSPTPLSDNPSPSTSTPHHPDSLSRAASQSRESPSLPATHAHSSRPLSLPTEAEVLYLSSSSERDLSPPIRFDSDSDSDVEILSSAAADRILLEVEKGLLKEVAEMEERKRRAQAAEQLRLEGAMQRDRRSEDAGDEREDEEDEEDEAEEDEGEESGQEGRAEEKGQEGREEEQSDKWESESKETVEQEYRRARGLTESREVAQGGMTVHDGAEQGTSDRQRQEEEELERCWRIEISELEAKNRAFRDTLKVQVRDKWDDILHYLIANEGVSTPLEYEEKVQKAKVELLDSYGAQDWTRSEGDTTESRATTSLLGNAEEKERVGKGTASSRSVPDERSLPISVVDDRILNPRSHDERVPSAAGLLARRQRSPSSYAPFPVAEPDGSNERDPLDDTGKRSKTAHSSKSRRTARKSNIGSIDRVTSISRRVSRSTNAPRSMRETESETGSSESSPESSSSTAEAHTDTRSTKRRPPARVDDTRSQKRARTTTSTTELELPEASGDSTPDLPEKQTKTKLVVEGQEEDDSAYEIDAPLLVGDAGTARPRAPSYSKEVDEELFKQRQRLLPSFERQIAGPSFDLRAEFSQTLQTAVRERERRWRNVHPNGAAPLRDGYKVLYEQLIRDAHAKEYRPGRQPSIRIVPLEDDDPTAWSSPDFELCYTNRVIYADGIVPVQAPGCACLGDCGRPENRANCACRNRQIAASTTRTGGGERSGHQDFAYNSKGVLDESLFRQNDPIIECNSQCGCGEGCINRVVGAKKAISVDIFRTLDKGWGVRNPFSYNDPLLGSYTQRTIKKGEPLGVYAGELITSEEGVLRDSLIYSKTHRCYTYSLDAWTVGEDYRSLAPVADAEKMIVSSTVASHKVAPHALPAGKDSGKLNRSRREKKRAETKAVVKEELDVEDEDEGFSAIYNVDAFTYGNWTRFANHNCQGFNVVTRTVYVDEADVTRPLWVYVAHRDIKPGEEITISYFSEEEPRLEEAGLDYRTWKKCAKQLRQEQPKNFRCYCDKPLCRGIMFNIDQEDLFFNRMAA